MTSQPGDAPGPVTPVDGMAQLSFVISSMLERQAAAHDLTMAQVRLLGILRDRTPTMQELAQLLGLDKSSTTGLVSRAERRGLVQRSTSATDRRSVRVSLALEGRALVSAAAKHFGTEVTALLGLLEPGDRDTLSSLIGRLLVAYAASEGIDLQGTVDGQGAAATGAGRRGSGPG
jgi:DNA-binding MarR family transcriptional regulator